MRNGARSRVLSAAILGSGAVFLEGTAVNVALPSIGRDFHLGLDGLQWIVDAYLLTLGALILLGGALGDRYPRERIFRAGCAAFAASSAACAIAPNLVTLVALRLVQGIAGALLVPNSLALLEEQFDGAARGAAVGRWAAGSAASTAIGPLAGGLIISLVSWRWIYAIVAPVAVAAALMLPRAGARNPRSGEGPIDFAGAALVTLGLGAVTAALIAGPVLGFGRPFPIASCSVGALLLLAFVAVERRARAPLLDLSAFRSRQFVGANLATLLIYGALGVTLFLLILVLQNVMGFGPAQAGSALLPVNVLLFVLSPVAGRIAGRVGPRAPMALGAAVAGLGLALFTRLGAGATYLREVLPAVLVFGLGLSMLVAPLTSAALDALGPRRAGLASGANNALARLAGLVAVAVVPLAAGMGGMREVHGTMLADGFRQAMWISAALCMIAAAVSWLAIPRR